MDDVAKPRVRLGPAHARTGKLRSVVLAALGVVHVLAATNNAVEAAGKAKDRAAPVDRLAKPAPPVDAKALPLPVQEMIEAIQVAVRSGRIEDMKDALDWNELKPELADGPVPDPIAHWKSLSPDGTGRSILELLGIVLARDPAIVPYGRDVENNRLYVWPNFADKPLKDLSADDAEHLTRIAPTADAMRTTGVYTGWRLVIGADGTWHSWRAKD
jgi:hypothetical protein